MTSTSKTIIVATALTVMLSHVALSQTLYVPSGSSGIGSSSNGNVGIGIGSPLSKLSIAGDLLIQNANLPAGLMTEVGGYTPLLNLSVNFREPNKDNTYRGAGFRIDTRGSMPLFQWLTRNAGSSTDNLAMVLTESGSLGIGTSSPGQILHMLGNLRIQGANSTIPHSYMEFYRYDGTKFATIGQGVPGLLNSTFDFQHYNGNDFRFLNVGNELVRITSDGKMGIGTSIPDQKLTVNGTVHATRVKVEATVPGPDYVFEKDYALLPLDQIKSYIDENKHLPEVPSAKEMEADGIDVGEMNLLLLKKIEELTLHAIRQQAEIQTLRAEIKGLKR